MNRNVRPRVLVLLSLPLLLVTATASSAVLRPSFASTRSQSDTGAFEPDGYYVPIARPSLPLANLHHLEVRTLGETDAAGRKANLAHPLVAITFKVTAGDELTIECGRARITRDSLVVTCPLASRRSAMFHVAFLDRRGRFWSLPEYDEQVREVARGRVDAASEGEPAVAQTIAFYYSAGH